MAQKLKELLVAVAGFALRDNLTGGHIKCGKQSGCAVTDVIVGDALNISQAHGQEGLHAVKGLDLAFFVHAQDHCLVRGVEIEPHDISNLLDEEGVLGEVEIALAVGRKGKGAPDAADGGFGDAGLLRHRATTPVCTVAGRGLNGLVEQRGYLFIRDGARPTWAKFIMQPLKALFRKSSPPFAHRGGRESEPFRDSAVAFALLGQQYDLGAPYQGIRH